MTPRHFKIFIAVCEAQNMTKAAEQLYISQSAVSQAIADLEAHYEAKLFERFSKRIYLTSAGETLLGYARHIISMMEEAETDIQSLSENGVIRIGASVTVGTTVVPEIVTSFKKAAPAARISVVEDNTAAIEALLLKNEIDFGLVEGEIVSPDIVSEPFMKDELVLISGQSHPFSQMPLIAPGELAGQDFIIREQGSGTRRLFESKMAVGGIAWTASWVCNNSETIKRAVASGIGVSVISARSVESERRAGTLFVSKIQGIEFVRSFKIVRHKNKYITRRMGQFIDHIWNGFSALE